MKLIFKSKHKIFLLLAFSLATILGVYYFYSFKNFYKKIYVENPKPTPKPEKQAYNLLLLGYGGPGHDGAYLTDTIIFAHIDKKQKKILLISIPRDLWVKVPSKKGEIFSKINALYTMGLFPKKYPFLKEEYKKGPAIRILKEAVERITGQKIDYFVAIDFKGFEKVIDTLGGVEVYLEKPIIDPKYPIPGKEKDLCGVPEEKIPEFKEIIATDPAKVFPCRFGVFKLPAGKVKLDGETALKFVRARHVIGEKGDFGRSKRQQILLKAVGEKVVTLGIIPKVPSILNNLQDHVRTDIPLSLLKANLKELYNFPKYKVQTFVISTGNFLKSQMHPQGGYILLPKNGVEEWGEIREYIKRLIEGKELKQKWLISNWPNF